MITTDYPICLSPTADNVLLSEDGKDTFLCDFGHAERLDNRGQSLSGSKGNIIRPQAVTCEIHIKTSNTLLTFMA